MKNCELAIGIVVGVLIGKACQEIKPKHPIKPVLPCECDSFCCIPKPPKKPDCKNCYYQKYKRC